MNDALLEELLRARQTRTLCALATVAATTGSVPRQTGSKMLVYGDGKVSGTIGGGKFEALVVEECLKSIATKEPLLKTYPLREDKPDSFGAICGGEVTVMIEPQLAPWRIGTFIFMLFGLLGALLAAVGLHGVVSFVVAQRTREFGVRLALGAQTGDVLRLVLRHGARLVLVGLAVGAIVAALSTRLFVSLMFGVSVLDPVVYLGMAAALAFVALLASYVPALRATRVDPIEALRSE